MTSTSSFNGIKGFKVLPQNQIVGEIVAYIETQLPLFLLSEEFEDITSVKKNENQHSTAFCVFMTNACMSKFCFQREGAQRGSSTIDISVYKNSKQVFNIEAKVLPTPVDASRLEHEYVHGKGAGIQRFKEGKHGLDDANNSLSQCGMIAYIKDNDFSFWLAKVNQWITDATWPSVELLNKIYFNSTAKLISEHERDDKSSIILHHFWVKV